MPEKVSIEQFLNLSKSIPVIDVRSPGEFKQGHIPNAVNIPLFNNDERAAVGIKYKQGGNENAVQLGLEIAGPKLVDFVNKARRIARNKKVLVHCWRGGMRSNSMAWLFEIAGLNANLLDGGYKSYRRHIRDQFSKTARIIALGGQTGSGKTAILRSLEKHGEQFLDIEKIAHHKGSAFGKLGEAEQPTNEQFENNLANDWLKFNRNNIIWVEDESRALGNCSIPEPLFKQIRGACLIKISLPKTERIKRLVKEYGSFEKELLLDSILKISQRLGGLAVKQAKEALDEGNMSAVAKLMLYYYDKVYDHEDQDKTPVKMIEIELQKDEPDVTAKKLKELSNQLF